MKDIIVPAGMSYEFYTEHVVDLKSDFKLSKTNTFSRE